ncbi:TfoX/Sxy family protein [Tenacibaculum sp. TC6]|uniref:TfoX/Sxy family protein n=1 Tax=Tenacibaculum sp. TC6 TaxID=3423223 RepID=UPI003D3610D8
MAYDQFLAERITHFFDTRNIIVTTKKMFGGVCFMVDDKMCVGVVKEEVMARIDPEIYEEALTHKGCSEMNFTGRPMKGYVFLSGEAIDLDQQLYYWLQLALDFNPKAKSSKKK